MRERLESLERDVAELRARLQEARDTTAALETIRLQIEAITRQLEELRLGRELVVVADSTAHGFGPAASKVYRVRQGVSIGGYGELLYENFAEEREDEAPSGKTDRLDFLRAILYAGYKFNDRFLFNSEIEFEHASTDQKGSVSIEFAYLDYRASEHFGIRGGLLLPPMGFLNELHEPPTFLGARRPETELRIIPSTWRENGVGIFGEAGRFSYRAYLVNGFDAVGGGSSGSGGFSASGVRGGRQKGSKTVAEDFAGVGRVDYLGRMGLTVGTSLYLGEAGQGNPMPSDPTREIGARTLIWEGHAEYRAHGFDLRGLFALADIDDVAELNEAKGLTGASSIGERLIGWYVQAGYDVLSAVFTEAQLLPYVRFEKLNTQDDVPAGFAADPANDREILTFGAAWKPIPNIVVKADYALQSNEADTGVDQLSVALGYLF